MTEIEASNILTVSDYKSLISGKQISDIREIPYFKESVYAGLDIPKTLEFYTKRYVDQLKDFTVIDYKTVIADIGAGFGWLSFAFLFSTNCTVIAVEPDKKRLDAGRQIAKILGVSGRIKWRTGGLGALPLHDHEADVVYCIEVLEHVYRNPMAVPDLCRITRNFLVITTPNLWFPVIAHDTRLPFCHWLPVNLRKPYAKLFGRENEENDNLFWSPVSLRKQMNGFKPVSKWLHYSSLKKFKQTYPFYLPYGNGSYVRKPGRMKMLYYSIIAKLGLFSHYLTPSLSYVFKRRSNKGSR
jgi:SAM-dependent methyltransferase